MPANTRFAVAIHTAGMIAFADCIPVSSESIARSVGTNPVVIRRLIGLLTAHGIVTVSKGQGGGAVLSRPPEEITLDQIYRAVEAGPIFLAPPASSCPMGKFVGPVLAGIFSAAESALLAGLGTVTLAQVIRSVSKYKKECHG